VLAALLWIGAPLCITIMCMLLIAALAVIWNLLGA
jgi:hypothetical protein